MPQVDAIKAKEDAAAWAKQPELPLVETKTLWIDGEDGRSGSAPGAKPSR